MAEITVLIRFKNSASTLPEVLCALQKQSLQPKHILAVDTGSTDGSLDLLKEAGANIIHWTEPYHHSKVLNFGLSKCETPLVLILSSHTVMCEDRLIERLSAPLIKDETNCACSIKWDEDPYYSDQIDWQEIQHKGIKFGSIYTNSLGLIRHANWKTYPFEEAINGMEDYDWALHHLKAGYRVNRIHAVLHYKRNAHNRDQRDAARAFFLARRYGLGVTWIGYRGAVKSMLKNLPGYLAGQEASKTAFVTCRRRLLGALFWRFLNLNID